MSSSLPSLVSSSSGPLPSPAPRRKIRQHVACQTDASELVELRSLQAKLSEVRKELADVTRNLGYAEQRLRYEMREELELRMKMQEDSCSDRVVFMRKRSERHVGQVRAASKSRLNAAITLHQRSLADEHRVLSTKQADLESREQEREASATERQTTCEMLLAENRRLQAEIVQLKHAVPAAPNRGERRPSDATEDGPDPAAVTVPRLEAALASRDRTIAVLRQQLADKAKLADKALARDRTLGGTLGGGPFAASLAAGPYVSAPDLHTTMPNPPPLSRQPTTVDTASAPASAVVPSQA